jgi:hypothetical protein
MLLDKKAGWQVVYLAEASVIHQGSATLKKLAWFERRTIFMRSLLYFFEKHADPMKCSLLRVAVVQLFSPVAGRPGLRYERPRLEP